MDKKSQDRTSLDCITSIIAHNNRYYYVTKFSPMLYPIQDYAGKLSNLPKEIHTMVQYTYTELTLSVQ